MEVLCADRSRRLGPPRTREKCGRRVYRYRMISSTFFFLFSQLGVGMMLTLLFISPRSIGNSFFKFASLTAIILLGVTIGFNFLFPSPVRDSQLPVVFLVVSAGLMVLYNRVVDINKFGLALGLLLASIGVRIATIVVSFAVLQLKRSIPLNTVVQELLVQQGIFFWPRIIFGVLVPIVLTAMIWSTVKIQHTQAATGLLYLAVVALLFGEFFSKFLLFAVSIPL